MVHGHDVRLAQHGRRPQRLDAHALVAVGREPQHRGRVQPVLQEQPSLPRRHGHQALVRHRVRLAAVRVLDEQPPARGIDDEELRVADRDHSLAAADRHDHRHLVGDHVVAQPPAPRAGGRVEPGDRPAFLRSDENHQGAVREDRRGGVTVVRRGSLLAGGEVHLPELATAGGVEREQVPERPETVHPVGRRHRCRDRAVEGPVLSAQRRCDGVAPQLAPRADVEGRRHVALAVGEERHGAAARHRDGGVAGPERRAPGDGEARALARLERAGGRAVVARAAQARPVSIRGGCEGARRDEHGQRHQALHWRESTRSSGSWLRCRYGLLVWCAGSAWTEVTDAARAPCFGARSRHRTRGLAGRGAVVGVRRLHALRAARRPRRRSSGSSTR